VGGGQAVSLAVSGRVQASCAFVPLASVVITCKEMKLPPTADAAEKLVLLNAQAGETSERSGAQGTDPYQGLPRLIDTDGAD